MQFPAECSHEDYYERCLPVDTLLLETRLTAVSTPPLSDTLYVSTYAPETSLGSFQDVKGSKVLYFSHSQSEHHRV